MAYITGEFQHPEYEINILVLQPTKDEINYETGKRIQIDYDTVNDYSPEELLKVLDWMKDTVIEIQKTFDKRGKKIKILKPTS